MLNRTEFIPQGAAGTRKETATLLVGTATEFGIDQHSILAAQGGFWITPELAAIIYDDTDQPEPEPTKPEPKPKAAAKKAASTKKTSGNRAAKNTEQE